MNIPLSVGVPLIVTVFDNHDALTPAGRPLAVPIPVAFTVVWVIGVRAVFTHSVGVADAAEAVLTDVTLIVPVAFTLPQPPVNRML
jgi:hypothetical protein